MGEEELCRKGSYYFFLQRETPEFWEFLMHENGNEKNSVTQILRFLAKKGLYFPLVSLSLPHNLQKEPYAEFSHFELVPVQKLIQTRGPHHHHHHHKENCTN